MLKKIDPAISTILVGGALALAMGFTVNMLANPGSLSNVTGAAHADTPTPVAQWAASATGRVEPKNGEVRAPL